MATTGLSRRRVLATAAAATAALSAPFVRGAHAAGKLSVGFWDHWVPGANDTLRKLAQQWADKEKIDLTLDFITSTGDKLRITMAAEAQAGSGHDALAMSTWLPASYADKLEPLDDVVQPLLQQNGAVGQTVEYLGKSKNKWIAVPTCVGTQSKPPCGRIDLLKQHVGIDVTQMYPAGQPANKELADKWDWNFFLGAAEKSFKGGHPFGMPLGGSSDAVDWVGAVFASHGSTLVDDKGEVTVKSDATRASARMVQEAGALPAARRLCLGRRLEQQDPGVGPVGADHEPAFGLGSGEARRAENRRAIVDLPGAERAEGPLRAVPAVLLDGVGVLAQQAGGEEPPVAPVAARRGRAAGRGQPGLRHPALRQIARLQDLGRAGPAAGHDLQLSAARRRADPVDRCGAGAARHRGADLHPGDDDQDDRALHPGRRIDRPGDRLGRRRARRLHARLTDFRSDEAIPRIRCR